ncbi:BXL4 [Symbiodinium natans]|uniref:BXL4 protein n=1 Tax=Symbiodinium natans TaxID=878477 RepID=A0A812IX45_9DINO|nr:BXL4 [Symbiodinium natans]
MASLRLTWLALTLACGKSTFLDDTGKLISGCGDFGWCDVKKPLEERLDLLVKEMTPEEKILQLSNDLFGGVPPIERLGLESYNYIREAAHGVLVRDGKPEATSFPQVVSMAASFNRSLFRAVGMAVGREARFMQEIGLTWGRYKGHYGGLVLQFNVNLFRDPRWGRGQETPGECPKLTAAFAEEYVKGIQHPADGGWPQAAASCKHYAAYSFEGGPTKINRSASIRNVVPGQSNVSRHNENAHVTARDFAESYAKPWEACAKAQAMGVMCAYNQVNGVPSCGDKGLLRKLLRDTWGFQGVVVTDCDSISDMYALQKYKSTPAATIEAALDAGTDVSCSPGFFKRYAEPGGAMDALLTSAVKDALRVRFRLGEFDPKPRWNPTWSEVSAGHKEMALEAALQSAVLLKNDGRLPLQKGLRLALLGPLRNATKGLLGNYEAWPVQVTSPLEGLKKVAEVVIPGEEMGLCGASPKIEKPDVDAVVVVGGLTGDDDEVQDPDMRPVDSPLCIEGCLEGEGCDRPHLRLAKGQQSLLETATSWGLPVVLVLISGGPLDLAQMKEMPNLAGILWMGYPGQEGGTALARLLVGERSPSGRLPQTFYRDQYLEHLPMNDYRFPAQPSTKYPGRGYRFVEDQWVVYPFGFGLSYDSFKYTWEDISQCQLKLRLDRRAFRDTPGALSVLFFLRPPKDVLRKNLVGFERVDFVENQSAVVSLTLTLKDFEVYDDASGAQKVLEGEWVLEVNSPAELTHTLRVTSNGCEEKFLFP